MISKSIGIIQRLLNEPLRPTECFPQRHIIDDEELLEIRHDINDLDLYRKIEEELGIDLVTLIKALKNGCYIKPWKEIKYSYEIRTGSDNINLFLLDENDNDYSLKDYGKTWALTREELL